MNVEWRMQQIMCIIYSVFGSFLVKTLSDAFTFYVQLNTLTSAADAIKYAAPLFFFFLAVVAGDLVEASVCLVHAVPLQKRSLTVPL